MVNHMVTALIHDDEKVELVHAFLKHHWYRVKELYSFSVFDSSAISSKTEPVDEGIVYAATFPMDELISGEYHDTISRFYKDIVHILQPETENTLFYKCNRKQCTICNPDCEYTSNAFYAAESDEGIPYKDWKIKVKEEMERCEK